MGQVLRRMSGPIEDFVTSVPFAMPDPRAQEPAIAATLGLHANDAALKSPLQLATGSEVRAPLVLLAPPRYIPTGLVHIPPVLPLGASWPRRSAMCATALRPDKLCLLRFWPRAERRVPKRDSTCLAPR